MACGASGRSQSRTFITRLVSNSVRKCISLNHEQPRRPFSFELGRGRAGPGRRPRAGTPLQLWRPDGGRGGLCSCAGGVGTRPGRQARGGYRTVLRSGGPAVRLLAAGGDLDADQPGKSRRPCRGRGVGRVGAGPRRNRGDGRTGPVFGAGPRFPDRDLFGTATRLAPAAGPATAGAAAKKRRCWKSIRPISSSPRAARANRKASSCRTGPSAASSTCWWSFAV